MIHNTPMKLQVKRERENERVKETERLPVYYFRFTFLPGLSEDEVFTAGLGCWLLEETCNSRETNDRCILMQFTFGRNILL